MKSETMMTPRKIGSNNNVDVLVGNVYGLIDKVYRELNSGNCNFLEEDISLYRDLRKRLHDVGAKRKDMKHYDNRFINLPWRDCGLGVPSLQ